MNLFKWETFKAHSGEMLDWKINCDALTDEDIKCLAKIITLKIEYKQALGIPRGGIKLALELKKYRTPVSDVTLIVDDVLTTGNSMERIREKLIIHNYKNIKGAVIFSRSKCPDWITPIFQLWNGIK